MRSVLGKREAKLEADRLRELGQFTVPPGVDPENKSRHIFEIYVGRRRAVAVEDELQMGAQSSSSVVDVEARDFKQPLFELFSEGRGKRKTPDAPGSPEVPADGSGATSAPSAKAAAKRRAKAAAKKETPEQLARAATKKEKVMLQIQKLRAQVEADLVYCGLLEPACAHEAAEAALKQIRESKAELETVLVHLLEAGTAEGIPLQAGLFASHAAQVFLTSCLAVRTGSMHVHCPSTFCFRSPRTPQRAGLPSADQFSS